VATMAEDVWARLATAAPEGAKATAAPQGPSHKRPTTGICGRPRSSEEIWARLSVGEPSPKPSDSPVPQPRHTHKQQEAAPATVVHAREHRSFCGQRLTGLNAAALGNLSNVASLDLGCNALCEVPAALLPPALEKLDASANNLVAVPAGLAQCTQLHTLVLSVNDIAGALPGWLFTLPRLKELAADRCDITGIDAPPASSDSLAPIESLNLSDNKLSKIPESLVRFPSLHSLRLGYNSIAGSLGPELGSLVALEELRLPGNALTSVAPSLGTALKALVRIDLARNALSEVPAAWFEHGAFPVLEELRLRGNAITELSGEVFGTALPRLALLDIAENKLAALQRPRGAVSQSLITIALGGNVLTALPEGLFGAMPSLILLDVSRNALRKLPADLGQSKTLRALYAGFNPFAELPTSLPPLLAELHLSGCACGWTKPAAAQCTPLRYLESLFLSATLIDAVPSGLMCSKQLRTADVWYNAATSKPLTSAPQQLRVSAREHACCFPRLRIGCADMQGRRSAMEDVMLISDNLLGEGSNVDLVALYDGHGGSDVASAAAQCVSAKLRELLQAKQNSVAASISDEEQWQRRGQALSAAVRQCIHDALTDANNEMKPTFRTSLQGATALLGLFITGKGRSAPSVLHVANIGDTRCVLCRDGAAVRLSVDHKPLDKRERLRVSNAGGHVTPSGQVMGTLAVSRAIGDYPLQPYVTCEPHIASTPLGPTDEFAIFACDGVWDVVSDKTAVDLVRSVLASHNNDPTVAAIALRDWAFISGSTDNISVIVTAFS